MKDSPSRSSAVENKFGSPPPLPQGNLSNLLNQGRPKLGLWLGVGGLGAWIIPLFGLPVTVTGLVFSTKALRSRDHGIAAAGTILNSIGLLLTMISGMIGYWSTPVSDSSGTPSQSFPEQALPASSVPFGLSREELRLSSATLYGSFTEEDLFFDDQASWTGSAAVFGEEDGVLLLLTNAHCLGEQEIAASDDDGTPELIDYQIVIEFPSGEHRQVIGFEKMTAGIDLAVLAVPSDGLQVGRDYVVVPYDDSIAYQQGDAVVAVGSPSGLHGSQTFGHVSAIRPHQAGHISYTVIQTDAAINPGSSGGPLFLKRNDRYVGIGINAWKLTEAEGLGFAIDLSVLKTDPFSPR